MGKGLDGFVKRVSLKCCFMVFLSLVYCFLFTFVFLLCFSGCSKNSRSNNLRENGKLNVVVTIFPLYDFLRQLVKDDVNLKMLMPPGVDTHSFEPSPEIVKSIENCDVLVYLGGDVDLWVEKALSSIGEQKKNRIKSINIIQSLGYSLAELPDLHVWLSLQNTSKIAKVLESNLAKIDVKNAATYSENLLLFISKLDDLKRRYENVIANGRRRVLAFADRFAFKHFIEEFGLTAVTPFANCSSKSEVSSSKVSELVDFVKKNNISIVLKSDFSEGDLANIVADETGAKVRVLFSCHTVSADDFSAGRTYLDFMEQNLETLKEALN